MRICLDFDGTIHEAHQPVVGRIMGGPMPGALEAVQRLQAAGHTFVIHSARVQQEAQAQHIYQWLRYYGFPQIPVSVPKPIADVYVDDRGFRFASWAQALPQLLGQHWGSASEG